MTERLRRAFEDFNRRDVEAFLEAFDPEVVWFPFSPARHQPGAWLFTIRDGLIVQVRTFGDHAEARRAARL